MGPASRAVASSVGSAVAASTSNPNPAGTRGAKEERMEELRLSLSRASRARVPEPGLDAVCRGELPFSMWDGIAEGFEGGEDPELMMEYDGIRPV